VIGPLLVERAPIRRASFDARSRIDHGGHTKKCERASLEGLFIEYLLRLNS
jgi:hypothetical protein